METIYNNLVQLLTYDPQSPIIFSSGLFLVLFVGFTLVYYLLHNTFTPRILFVTLFSYYFYYKSMVMKILKQVRKSPLRLPPSEIYT
jgi:alginate O-acetyltransferase complex protein AlgI